MTVVLSNVLELDGSPYVRLWNEAAERSGARLCPLTAATVRGRPDWVHLQWPERVLRHPGTLGAARNLARLLVLVAAARALGARVMVTAHNVWAHDSPHPRLERVLWFALGPLTTDLHLLGGAGAGAFLRAHPTFRRARRRVIPHGTFEPAARGAPARAAARAALGLPDDAHVLITFGMLRAYKGVEELLDAFAAVEDPRARLVIAGRVADERLGRRLEATADSRVLVLPRFLEDAELAGAIRAADRVVLPYRRVLNSGAAFLALALDRPVLLPRSPAFEELRTSVGPGWVDLFDAPLGAADLAAADVPDGRPDLAWCSWDVVTERLEELWRA